MQKTKNSSVLCKGHHWLPDVVMTDVFHQKLGKKRKERKEEKNDWLRSATC
jgi:hypothetical protein